MVYFIGIAMQHVSKEFMCAGSADKTGLRCTIVRYRVNLDRAECAVEIIVRNS